MHSPFKDSTSASTQKVLIFITTIIIFISLSSSHQYPADNSTPEKLFTGVKNRLGSTPPSCHNKCNQCHPCMAVQVPTPPSHHVRVQPRKPVVTSFDDPSSPAGNNYSNYKPLSWKCRCNNHLYNP